MKGVKPIRSYSRQWSGLLFALFLLSFWVFFVGCAGKGDVRATAKKNEAAFQKIAVVPFQVLTDESSSTVRCPITGTMARSCRSPEDAAGIVEELFLDKLKTYKQLIIIPSDKTEGIFRRVQAESFKARPVDVLREVGKELEADGVVAGYVYCYRERKGYPYSVEKPASVSFEIGLVRVSNGAVAWDGYFDKTQATLMENLFQLSTFMRAGLKWVTVKELAEEGIDGIMETFPVSPK